MGPGVTKNLPQSDIVNTSDDMANALENIAYNNLITRNEFIPKIYSPREGLIQTRKTSRDFPVQLLTGRSNVAKEVPDTRKATFKGLPLTPEKALAKTEKSAQNTSNDMINLINSLSEQLRKASLERMGGIQYTDIPNYALAAYRAVPLTYGAGLGLLGTGAGGAYMLGGRNE
jgi:hypothetical protein